MEATIAFAGELARESEKIIMGHFRTALAVERKADRSPVTVADREAERRMREMIHARFPADRVMGEEDGASGPEGASREWMLDPIDGTKSYIHGVPLFGTLIALLEEGQPVLGVIHIPAAGETLIGAQGFPTTLNGRPARVSDTPTLAEATVVYTSGPSLERLGHGAAFREIQARARLVRGWGDCYGHFLVATGRADCMLDPVLNPWDVAALRPCVEGAGGHLTDIAGRTLPLGESALSSNGKVHQEVLEILKKEGE